MTSASTSTPSGSRSSTSPSPWPCTGGPSTRVRAGGAPCRRRRSSSIPAWPSTSAGEVLAGQGGGLPRGHILEEWTARQTPGGREGALAARRAGEVGLGLGPGVLADRRPQVAAVHIGVGEVYAAVAAGHAGVVPGRAEGRPGQRGRQQRSPPAR